MMSNALFDTTNEGDQSGHACFFYEKPSEQLEMLAIYFQEGLAKNELCVFVSPTSTEQIIESFAELGFDSAEAIDKGALRIFEMNQTYLPDGKFAANFMLGNVMSFLEDAKAQGYSGLRTAGEMSWLHDNLDSTDEAIHYEALVNDIHDDTLSFTGICLYPMQETFSNVFEGVLHTHPSFIYNGSVRPNPHFNLAKAYNS